MSKVWAITVEGMETMECGVKNYLWATETQFQDIMEMLQDETKRNNWITIGDKPIQLKRIKDFKRVELDYAKDLPSFKNYLIERIEKEKQLGIGEWHKEIENKEGIKRINDLKAKYQLNKGVE